MEQKKTQEEIEKEILKEAAEAAAKEKKEAMAAKTEAPKAEKPTVKEKVAAAGGKKTGGLMKEALETVKGMREGKKEGAKERKIKFERVYTIPIRQLVSRPRRVRVAVRNLKDFVQHHTKAKDIKIEQELNEHIWERGYKKPPIKVRVSVSVDEEGLAVVNLKK